MPNAWESIDINVQVCVHPKETLSSVCKINLNDDVSFEIKSVVRWKR